MGELSKQSHYLSTTKALFDGQIQGLTSQIYENEFPPCGLAGALDWYFQGAISHFIQKKFISGKKGECIYLPITKNSITYHLFCIGGGQTSQPGERSPPSLDTLHLLQKNLISLQLNKVGVSKTDLGDLNSDFLTKHLKGVPLWIAP